MSYLHHAISDPAHYRALRARDEALEREANTGSTPGVLAPAELDVAVRKGKDAKSLLGVAVQDASLTTMLAGLWHRSARPSHLVPPQYFGSYTGVSPLAVLRGASFDESLVRLAVNEHGLVRQMPVGEDVFFVRYDNRWMVKSKFAEPPSYAVGQSPGSALAQAFFTFREPNAEGPLDVVETYGEGIPATLGAYLKDTDAASRASELRAVYDSLVAERPAGATAAPSPNKVAAQPIDLDAAKFRFLRGSTDEKVTLLAQLTANLWTLEPREIRARLDLVTLALALRDRTPEVQRRALEVFTLNARVIEAVPIVARELDYAATLHPQVQTAAVHAAACLLYEATRYLSAADALTAKYGTADVAALRRATSGLIDANDVEHVQTVSDRSASRVWTHEHVAQLTDRLHKIAANARGDYAREAETMARKTLAEYASSSVPRR